ncbi:MAG: TlpA family protein disulfide reductase [Saprospiraceae bacterium]|jgi:thiol-disulfide isomerase/thioredoxin|nr:TlpA family protein disulfide reductase [Saprospiraceae bacterium]
MSVKYLTPLLFLFTISFGCRQYPLTGNIEMNGSNKYPMLYLVDPVSFNALASSYAGKLIDSAIIDKKGNFKFDKLPVSNDKKMYILTIQKTGENYPNRLENDPPDSGNYLPFIYQSPEPVKIQSTADNLLKDASIQGNTLGNDEVVKLIKMRLELYNRTIPDKEEVNESNLMELEKAKFTYQKEMMSSLSENTDVLINALALKWVSPSGDYERVPELVKQTCQKINKTSPDHPWTIQICKISESLPLTQGDLFPDFPMPMANGDTVNIYKILGSKLTVIDLWASWCAPCRLENKNTLVPMWDEFHNKGLQIIGYALDSGEKAWKNAIEKDGADRWLHASHLKGDVSPLFEQLKITMIPANYIVDHKGVIMAKNLHGEELYQWVAKYFK